MEDFLSGLIPLFFIVSIIFSIINKAKKSQSNTSKTHSVSSTNKSAGQSLQDIIRQQIEEQKQAAMGMKAKPQNVQSVPKPEPVSFSEGNYVNRASLENKPTEMQRHSHNVHIGGSYNEGDALNRTTLEGELTEMQRHAHKVHPGGSYNEGDALNRYSLEGIPVEEYEDKFDLDEVSRVSKSAKKGTKMSRQALSKSGTLEFKLDRKTVVNGIIMSEILNKRGGRRAT